MMWMTYIILLYLYLFIMYTEKTYIVIGNFLKNLDSMTFEVKISYCAECNIWIIQQLYYKTKRVILKGRTVYSNSPQNPLKDLLVY